MNHFKNFDNFLFEETKTQNYTLELILNKNSFFYKEIGKDKVTFIIPEYDLKRRIKNLSFILNENHLYDNGEMTTFLELILGNRFPDDWKSVEPELKENVNNFKKRLRIIDKAILLDENNKDVTKEFLDLKY